MYLTFDTPHHPFSLHSFQFPEIMMIAVHPIRASPTRTSSSESAMSIWKRYDAMMESIEAASSSSGLKHKKRNRDSFEAYDFQAHKHQKMRYSLLREEPNLCSSYRDSYNVYPRDNLVSALSANPRLTRSPIEELVKRSKTINMSISTNGKTDETRRMRRNKKVKKSKRGSHQRMTRKFYNKKKRLEMMEATDRHIQGILGNTVSQISDHTLQRVKYYKKKVEQLDLSLRDQCNSIVYKEQDIKSWLGMTTRSRSKIISLRKRLHDRWAEVKDLQSIVKPRRQRLKNLKFAVMCEERTIPEE